MNEGRDSLTHYFVYLAQGGACGLLNAAWLREIETRTNLPIARLASFMAAASVGAIHAAGMVLPCRENPGNPAYSAAEHYEIFREELPRFLPHDPGFYARQVGEAVLGKTAVRLISHVLLRARNGHKDDRNHYSLNYPETRLREIFGQASVADALTGIAISSHRISPSPAGPCDFIHLPPESDGKRFYAALFPGADPERLREEAGHENVPLCKAVLASMVCPTVFKSYEIPEHGIFTDMGGVNSPLNVLMAFGNSLPPGHRVHFVYLGTGALRREIDEKIYNGSGFLQTITPMLDMTSMHVSGQSLNLIRSMLGPENVTVIDAVIPGERNILDTSPPGIARLEDIAGRSIQEQRETFERLADGMGSAYLRRTAPALDATFTHRPAQSAPLAPRHRSSPEETEEDGYIPLTPVMA